MTLALRVLGSAVTNFTSLGRRALPSSWITRSIRASRSSSDGAAPGLSTAKITTSWSLMGWGTPMAADSATSGCALTMASTSAGPSRLPATLMVSSLRPRRYQSSSSSMAAKSPWTQTSGKRLQ